MNDDDKVGVLCPHCGEIFLTTAEQVSANGGWCPVCEQPVVRFTEDEQERMRRLERMIGDFQGIIARHGWAITGSIDVSGTVPPLLYTVGLAVRFDVELCVVGLPPAEGHPILNLAATRLRDGDEMLTGMNVVGLVEGGIPVRFVQIGSAHALSMAVTVQRRTFDVWQMIYPDIDGRWPTDPDCKVRALQVIDDLDQPWAAELRE